MNDYSYDELKVGQSESFTVTVSEEMMQNFRGITGDFNPLHIDESYAKDAGYQDKVVYGMLTASFFSTLAGMYLPGKRSLIHTVETEFPMPVYVGAKLTITGTVKEKNDTFHTVILKVEIFDSDHKKVCRGKMRVGLLGDSAIE